MATTLLDKQQRQLIKKFHTLLGKAGVDAAGKEAILSGYGVSSTKDMSAYELLEACNALDKLSNPKAAAMDKERKRVLASIGGYLRMIGAGGYDIEKIKRIACRASEYESFNQIPLEKLRSLYNTFKNKQKIAEKSEEVMNEVFEDIKTLN